ncbi:flavin-dependent oxidoreductase [Roseateles sp.]|jgi:2-polyprenyl-6-methoxyphenol hydroxylase-like FAD-dependent oxidoreductase|uniref:flavin-dependent oxidoreductase n=1 Tax=Roseateles sp. TaxID=1971397 RepID=UPI0037CAB80E
MDKPLNILIAGGGIGGLTAALALHAKGHRVTVCEATAELKPLGVGINLLPHAVAVLDTLGLLPALRAMAVETSALVFANRHGQEIYRDPRGLDGGYSHPQLSIHRGQLQLKLWDEALARLGAEQMHTGERLLSARMVGNQVIAQFQHADDSSGERSADVLIGADGIHSALRRQFYPDEGAPRWNGMMMWRGTSIAKPFLDGRTMVQAGHRLAKFVVYPIAPPAADGTQLVNWICDRRLREDGIGGGLSAPSREDWSKPGQLADLLPTFGSWHFPWLDVPGLIQQATQLLEWPMVDRDPLPRWSHGCITLLGDAAHPMYPIGSNGATQAILDAQCLAEQLGAGESIEAALRAYESERLPICARIVEMNRQEGLDAILDLVEQRAPAGFERLADVIDPAEIDTLVRQYKAAAGHRQQ